MNYDIVWPFYDAFALTRLGQDGRIRRQFVQFIGIKKGSTVLDVGCGTGRTLPILAESASKVVGIDVCEGMLKIARRRCSKLPNVQLRRADARRLPFDDGAFDVVVCANALRCIPHFEKAFDEMARVARQKVAVLEADWPPNWPMRQFYRFVYLPIDRCLFRPYADIDINHLFERFRRYRHATTFGGLMHMWVGEK